MTDQPSTDDEWKEKLTPEQFEICRNKGTEIPFTGKYTNCERQGIYHCSCCDNLLFDSKTKYNSRTGWPSFWDVINDDNISQTVDESHGMNRVEVSCKSCGSHLGHIFKDGPKPTGLRYCINSISLQLKRE